MDGETQRRLGQGLILASVVGMALFLAASAVLSPPISKTSANAGETLVGVQGAPTPGKILHLNSGGEVTWQNTDAESYHDVTYLDNGNVLSTPITGDHEDCGQFESPCKRTGVRILDPETDEIVFEWTYPVRDGLNSEVHDAEVLPSGEILVVGMEYERVFTLARNGTITWQWNASEHYDAPEDPTEEDWLHMNDVDRIEEGRYLVSVRNENQLLFIERGEGVTEVVNEFSNPTIMRAQHNPQYLDNETILVADSENNRVVELERIGDSWFANWTLSSAGGIEFDWPRDADRLPNGNTLITDSRNNRVIEVTESGEVVWSREVQGLPYEADRLPGGEKEHGAPYGNGGGSASAETASDDGLPFFSTAYVTLTHVAPVPYWLNQWHVVGLTVALVGVAAGLVLWRSA